MTGVPEQSHSELDHVSNWVLATYPNARVLDRIELSGHERPPLCGWLIPFVHEGSLFNLSVVIPQDFPWDRPRVFCREKFEFQKFPHVEKDGAFCLYPPEAEHDPLNPLGLVRDAIKEATRLVASSFDDAFLDDFYDEFDSYWSKTKGGRNVVSLLSPGGPSRIVSLWRSKVDYYLAESDEALKCWLDNRFPSGEFGLPFETAAHIVLKRPIRPTEYPKSGAGILRVVRELAADSIDLITSAAEDASDKFTVSFEGRTDNGPVFFSVEVMPPVTQGMPTGRRPDMLQKGFRPSKVPRGVRSQRWLGGNSVERHEVMRADASWIHGRDTLEVAPLFSSRVVMIGAGSLGSEVASLLAKTGVGAITVIDPELLDYPNVGRHALGVSDVRAWKSKALVENLREKYPHMHSVEHFEERWQQVYEKRAGIFHVADMVVSTVGNWLTEARLNQVALADRKFPPVLYGWTEPYSVAGHAVLIEPQSSCLSCGMDRYGNPLRTVCEWEGDTTRKQPHCGASFQPYGPISLARVAALVAKTTTDALLGKLEPGTEAVYWASEEEILEHGGQFSADFKKKFSAMPIHGGSCSFPWNRKEGCSFCGGK